MLYISNRQREFQAVSTAIVCHANSWGEEKRYYKEMEVIFKKMIGDGEIG